MNALVQGLCDGLERSHTEKTRLVNGKTKGRIRSPRNWKVGHAIKGLREHTNVRDGAQRAVCLNPHAIRRALFGDTNYVTGTDPAGNEVVMTLDEANDEIAIDVNESPRATYNVRDFIRAIAQFMSWVSHGCPPAPSHGKPTAY